MKASDLISEQITETHNWTVFANFIYGPNFEKGHSGNMLFDRNVATRVTTLIADFCEGYQCTADRHNMMQHNQTTFFIKADASEDRGMVIQRRDATHIAGIIADFTHRGYIGNAGYQIT